MHDDGVLYNIHNDELRINCLIESIIVLRMNTVDKQREKMISQLGIPPK